VWGETLRPRRSRRLLTALRTLFIVAAVLPLFAPLFECCQWSAALGAFIRSLYGLQCHQRAGRSFTLLGGVLPVCARCYGIYLGLGLAALVGRPRLRPNAYKAWILIGAIVVLVDVASEWVGLRTESAWFRATTGRGAAAAGFQYEASNPIAGLETSYRRTRGNHFAAQIVAERLGHLGHTGIDIHRREASRQLHGPRPLFPRFQWGRKVPSGLPARTRRIDD
jgi:uncharacterized membrane protein